MPLQNSKEKKEMKKARNVSRICRAILGVMMMVLFSVSYVGFISMAAESIEMPDVSEENTKVEVLEAKIIEDVDISSEIVPYTMLASCIITARGASDGMHVDISTGTVGTASVLGVKDIKIYKKTWYGGWDLVAVCSGGESYNRVSMGLSFLYENAVKDAKYKITCIHYGDVNGYIEGENDSGEFTFTY